MWFTVRIIKTVCDTISNQAWDRKKMGLINAYKTLVENLEERDHLHKLGADGRKLLQQMLNK